MTFLFLLTKKPEFIVLFQNETHKKDVEIIRIEKSINLIL